MRATIFLLFILVPFWGITQAESLNAFTLDSFLEQVKSNHPVALQANLQTEMGAANLRRARGGFDPKIQSEIAQKYFESKEYYDLGESKFKIPTWFGIELEGGYERNQGEFLNAESTVPNAGLWFAGVSLPIGKGLFIDERRADLRKAQSIVDQTQAEKELILNDLLFQAGLAYWAWFQSFNNLQVYQEALVVAQQRFDAVKQSTFLGDAPFIDTLEAGIQLQNRILNLRQTQLNYNNAKAFLSFYLWQDGLIPLELRDDIMPEAFSNSNAVNLQLNGRRDSLINNHPDLRKGRAKIDQLEIEERWSREQLKPELRLKYQPLVEAVDNNLLNNYSTNNYSWGLSFEFPILLRKERGKLDLVKLKVNESNYLLENKREMLEFKVTSAINEIQTTQSQIALYTQTTQDYEGLLEGERRLFSNGESSLFLVNSRELGFINAQIKLIELQTKNQQSVLKLGHSLGTLVN